MLKAQASASGRRCRAHMALGRNAPPMAARPNDGSDRGHSTLNHASNSERTLVKDEVLERQSIERPCAIMDEHQGWQARPKL